jgi:hypothetical protein
MWLYRLQRCRRPARTARRAYSGSCRRHQAGTSQAMPAHCHTFRCFLMIKSASNPGSMRSQVRGGNPVSLRAGQVQPEAGPESVLWLLSSTVISESCIKAYDCMQTLYMSARELYSRRRKSRRPTRCRRQRPSGRGAKAVTRCYTQTPWCGQSHYCKRHCFP